jgi:hypothetical protein
LQTRASFPVTIASGRRPGEPNYGTKGRGVSPGESRRGRE